MAASIFTDGYAKLCIDPSLNFAAAGCSALLEGQYVVNPALATAIVPDTVYELTSPRYIDDMFTAGSVLAESLKTAFKAAPRGVKFSVIPRLDAAGAVKSVYTLTVAGPATSNGTFSLYMGEAKWNISFPVTSGATDAQIATLLQAAIAAKTSFPYVATVAAGVVTLTAKNGGTVGNFLVPIYNWSGFQNYAPSGVSVTVAHPTVGSVDPAPISYANALGTCCYSCYGLLSDDPALRTNLRDWIADQWDCEKPMCFGHGFTYASGSVGQVLATWDNQAELNVIPVTVNPAAFPWLHTANQVALKCKSACDNPELSNQGTEDGALSAVQYPASCKTEWTVDEMAMLREKQFNVIVPDAGGVGQLTHSYVTQDTTLYMYDSLNRRNTTWRDTSSRYLDAKTAVAVVTELKKYQSSAVFKRGTDVKPGKKGITSPVLNSKFQTWAQSQVGELWSEFDDIRRDVVITEDFETAPACQGVPGLFRLNLRYNRPPRNAGIVINMQPSMLDNCTR